MVWPIVSSGFCKPIYPAGRAQRLDVSPTDAVVLRDIARPLEVLGARF